MASGIQVDYMGDGVLMDAFPGFAKVTNIMGAISVPSVELYISRDGGSPQRWTWSMEFTLPVPVTNPYLQLIGIKGCDHFFTPVNESAGKWKLTVIARVAWYYINNNINYKQYSSELIPGGNAATSQTRIIYGGFRG